MSMRDRMLTSQLADKLVDYLYDPLDNKIHFGLKITDDMIDWSAVENTINKPNCKQSHNSQLQDFFKIMLEKTALGDLGEDGCDQIKKKCHCKEYKKYYNSLTPEEKAKLKVRVGSGLEV